MRGRRRREPARRLNRQQVIYAVMVTGAMALLAFTVGVWTLVASQLDANRKIDLLYQSATENRAKLVSVGEAPVGPPPEQIIGQPGPAGATGPQGATGPAGRDGRDGRDGKDGRDATPAQVAAAVAAYLKAHPPKPGAAGQAGRDGRDGQSPACLAEVNECRGPTGPAGPAGADGAAGANGQPPSAWLWTDPATKVSYECRRAADTPDTAPVYACTVVT